jgi:menaquinone-dependent protoporphyrinogen oxidase
MYIHCLPIFYSTRDGHSACIAEQIANRLSSLAVKAQAVNAASFGFGPGALEALPVFVLVAAIRYGRHMQDAEAALDAYSKLASKPPLALASVNLTARKPDKRTAQSNPYLRKWIKRRKLKPELAIAIAGRLDYPRYSTFDRIAIQLIMTITKGPTDPATVVDFTDWNAVDAFADRIAERIQALTAPG